MIQICLITAWILIMESDAKVAIDKICKTGLLRMTLNMLENKCYEEAWEEAAWLLLNMILHSRRWLKIHIEKKFKISKSLPLMLKNSMVNEKVYRILVEVLFQITSINEHFSNVMLSPKKIFIKGGGMKYLPDKINKVLKQL